MQERTLVLAMTKEVKSLKSIQVRYQPGGWFTECGQEVFADPGTRAELVLTEEQFEQLWPRDVIELTRNMPFLHTGAKLRFALKVVNLDQLKVAQARHLIDPRNMWDRVEWGPVRGWYSSDAHFVEIELGVATDEQIYEDSEFSGGLQIKLKGHEIMEVIPSRFGLPKDVSDIQPVSLNHAYTLLSEVYETHRMSHTGNIFERVFYQGADDRWYPLGLLRQIGRQLSEGRLADYVEESCCDFWNTGVL